MCCLGWVGAVGLVVLVLTGFLGVVGGASSRIGVLVAGFLFLVVWGVWRSF